MERGRGGAALEFEAKFGRKKKKKNFSPNEQIAEIGHI